ncbi:MAG: multidrug efflux SMR transporter [Verrucomicrobiota bacterium]
MTTAWIYLIVSAVCEVFFGIGVYHSRGFTLPWPSALAVGAGIITTLFLSLGMKHLPIGLSFVVWSGLAAVGTAAYGILFLGESRDLVRLGLMALIVAGSFGLKLTSSH